VNGIRLCENDTIFIYSLTKVMNNQYSKNVKNIPLQKSKNYLASDTTKVTNPIATNHYSDICHCSLQTDTPNPDV